jgi:hypothetical protein
MQVEFFEPVLEQNIVREITQWSRQVLEPKSEFFNGMPACPFAEKAWKDDKVSLMFKYENSYQCLYSTVSTFDDNFDVSIIIDLNFEEDPEDFHDYLYEMNKAISGGMFINKDVWLMGFHPYDAPNEFVADCGSTFEPVVEDEYAMIFVQRLSKLQESADKLAKRGYYKSYEADYNAKELFNNRSQLYRRLKNGNGPQEKDA